jgi:hypothetical protein
MSRVELLKSALKNRAVLEQTKTEERIESALQPVAPRRLEKIRVPEKSRAAEKSSAAERNSRQAEEVQVKKKANFSRYAQENEELGGTTKR